jgi:hypothetical protein
LNLFEYVGNNPLSYVGPGGRSPVAVVSGWGANAVAGFAAGIAGMGAIGGGAIASPVGITIGIAAIATYPIILGIQDLIVASEGETLVVIGVDESKYPESAKHIRDCLGRGFPAEGTIDGDGEADRRRDARRINRKPGFRSTEWDPGNHSGDTQEMSTTELLRHRTHTPTFLPDSAPLEEPFAIDPAYRRFVELRCGGHYFANSLHIYAHGSAQPDFELLVRNEFMRQFFGSLAEGLFFFAEDIFGDQFAFAPEGVVSFQSESGDLKFLTSTFEEWTKLILNDPDYYSGRGFLLGWEGTHGKKLLTHHLCGKMPFVAGGEYDESNIFVAHWTESLGFKSSIAKQIAALPDGTPIRFEIKSSS